MQLPKRKAEICCVASICMDLRRKLNPLITFVLYAGKDTWDGPKTLYDMLDFTDIPETLKEMTSKELVKVKDYSVKGGKKDVCKAIRDLMDDSREKGREEGREIRQTEVYYEPNNKRII